MRCEEAFEHLSRPEGEGAANGRLKSHLAACPLCRELAELFRPAVALMGTRGGPDEDADVPDAWRRVWEAVAVAERAAEQLRSPRGANGNWWRRYGWPACTAAALLIGVLTGVVVGNAGGGEKPQAAAAPPMANGPASVSCDLLLTVFRDAATKNVCPTCGRPVKPHETQVVSLCAVCHLPQHREFPADAATPAPSDPADDTAQPTEAPTAS